MLLMDWGVQAEGVGYRQAQSVEGGLEVQVPEPVRLLQRLRIPNQVATDTSIRVDRRYG